MFLRDKLYVQHRIHYGHSENTNICLPLSINLHLRCGSCGERTSADHSRNELKFHTAKTKANKRQTYSGFSKRPVIHGIQLVLIAGPHDARNGNFRVKATNDPDPDPAHVLFPVKQT
jgi:hypothetical protein